ncbi:hypothetical protein LGH83_00080 [Lichenihabitans sp. PAMC28606]|uniref:hypothetical protein n=1 Tax=Lichenihabitans TaxID=2723776 RepID=UPI00103830DD|nr:MULTISPECIES: hypothetical protein [Lichenihabitans]UDL94730.1 hypothetical protein LGH83_00080 [Lichenihabitans sp. PAMC28606]
MTVFKALLIVAVTGCSVAPAFAFTKGPTLRDRQQAACYDDAQRLCGEFVPDVNKVTTCMKAKKAEVSPKCAAAYKLKR